jgi:NAD(P)-dependent dehydrogenase (short-subunit alcohol dehydrogenase family)
MISGANRGIGAAIARQLAAGGWRLSIGVRNPQSFAAGAGDLVHRFDALEGTEAAWVAATMERFGRIDAVINNAGIIVAKSVIEADDDDLMAMFRVNVQSPLRLVRAAWPHLAACGRGRVIMVASLSGKRVKSAQSSLYAVTKHAAVALSHGIRQSGWDLGIRATALCPGFVATDMARGLTDISPDAMTQPEDLARMVALLLDLPNTASVAELAVNGQREDSY